MSKTAQIRSVTGQCQIDTFKFEFIKNKNRTIIYKISLAWGSDISANYNRPNVSNMTCDTQRDQNTLETYNANNARIKTNGRTVILKQ